MANTQLPQKREDTVCIWIEKTLQGKHLKGVTQVFIDNSELDYWLRLGKIFSERQGFLISELACSNKKLSEAQYLKTEAISS